MSSPHGTSLLMCCEEATMGASTAATRPAENAACTDGPDVDLKTRPAMR